MFCEAYNQSLTEAAAAGELSPALQRHLASCESCRAAFADEQSLFAAIDSGLRAAAISEVPATLISRVHVALNNESIPQRSFQKWIFATGGLACALIVAITLQLRHREVTVPSKTVTALSPLSPSPQLKASPPSVPSAVHEIPRQAKKPEAAQSDPMDSVTSITAEVLVPDEERAAFAQFMAHTSGTAMNVPVRATPVPNAPQESVQISPMEIASLQLKPLNPKEGQQAQF